MMFSISVNFFILSRFFMGNAELAIWPTLILARFWAKVAEAILAGCNISKACKEVCV